MSQSALDWTVDSTVIWTIDRAVYLLFWVTRIQTQMLNLLLEVASTCFEATWLTPSTQCPQ